MKKYLLICITIIAFAACNDDPSGPATGDRSINVAAKRDAVRGKAGR